jgi:hypothetical protein
MAEGFKIADAYVEVEAEIDEAQVRRASSAIGESAGLNLGDKLSAGISSKMSGDEPRRRKDGEKAGSSLGKWMGSSTSRTFARVFSGQIGAIFTNPVVLGTFAAAGAVIAPALGAGIAGGLIGGAGLGAIAGGIALIADRPEIKKAARSLKDRFMDIDTTGLEQQVLAAQDRLAAARKSKNKTAIKDARTDLRTLQADLNQAQAFNEKNFSLKDAAGPLIQPVLGALKIFQDSAGRIIPKIGEMFAELDSSGAIPELATGIVALVENALPGLLSMVKASGPFLKSLGPGLAEMGKGIGLFAGSIAKVGPEASVFFSDLFSFLSAQLAMWGDIIAVLARAYAAMHSFFAAIPGWVSSAGSGFSSLWDGIVSKGSAMLTWFGALPGRVGGWVAQVGLAVRARGAAILAWFGALPGRVGAALAVLPDRAKALFVRMFDTVTTAIGFGLGVIVRMWLDLPERIFAAAIGLIVKVRSLFTQARQAAITTVVGAFNALAALWNGLPLRLYLAAVGIIARVRSIFTSARSAATSASNSLVSSVISILHTLPGRAASAVSAFATVIGARLRGAVGAAYGIGQDIISGVIRGIGSMVGAAVGAARRAAGNIVSGMKGALGIGSASKVMAREVGRWLLPGVGVGIESSIPAARRAVQDAADSLVPRVPGVGAAGLSGASGGPTGAPIYNFAPGSIVIDASSLRSVNDLLAMIDRLEASARAMRPRMATVGA